MHIDNGGGGICLLGVHTTFINTDSEGAIPFLCNITAATMTAINKMTAAVDADIPTIISVWLVTLEFSVVPMYKIRVSNSTIRSYNSR